MREIEGQAANISAFDDSVYITRQPSETQKDVYRYLPDTDELSKVKSLTLDDYEHADVDEIVGVSRTAFIYRASGAHVNYYFRDDGQRFSQGDGLRGGFEEQDELTLSNAGRLAAHVERWGGAKGDSYYVVLINMKTNRRQAVRAIGASLRIRNGRLYFMSDPAIGGSSDAEFKRIEHYALYSYDPKTGAVTLLRRFPGYAQLAGD